MMNKFMAEGNVTTIVPAQEVFPSAETLDRFGGDINLLSEISSMFLDGLPEMLSTMNTAIASGNEFAVERAAHAIKGVVSNFGESPAQEAAFRLEMMGRKCDLSAARELANELETELARLRNILDTFVKENAL
ncbi:MAG TPA: Hpt domain-containing protein [Blastocatellia bacterium]|nr:Hpt domain-containing protein [Blastocatellia bacterium]